MGRPIKIGLDYFPLDTCFFQNPKIKALRRDRGSIGIAVYLNILCRVYGGGYYYKFTSFNGLCTDIAEDIVSERDQIRHTASKVAEVLHYMLEQGLLDRGLFEVNVVSSVPMQEQYISCATAAKRKVQLGVYSLLGVREGVDAGECTQKNRVSSEEMRVSSEEMRVSSEESTQSKSKSKSKSKNTLYTYSYNAREDEEKISHGTFDNVMLSREDLSRLERIIPEPFLTAYIDHFSLKMISHKYKYDDHCKAILEWWASDKDKFMERYSEDEDYEEDW